MHFKSRFLATVAVLAMAAVVAYGSTMEMSGVEEVDSRFPWFDQKETIYCWYSDETLTNYINSAAVYFGEREGVRVIPILTSEGEYLEAINRETMTSDQVPDVYLLSNDSLEKAYMAGLATEVVDIRDICNEEYFPQAALDAVSYHDEIIAYPMFYETSALVYNQTYLEEWARQQAEKAVISEDAEGVDEETGEPIAGAEIDQAKVEVKKQEFLQKAVPRTVDELLNFADSFDVPEGVEGIMKWDVSDIFYNYWVVGKYMEVGGDAGDRETQTNINNPETISCLEVYQTLNQFFSIESDTVTYESVIQDFMDGKTVFTIGTTDVVEKLAQAKEDGSLTFEYGITTMPEISEELKSRSLSVTNCVVVNGYSEHIELANRFAACLTNDYVDNLYERTGRMSTNKNANVEDEALQVFFAEYADSVSLPKMMVTGNFWIQLEVLFAKAWNGEDVTALIEELAENIEIQMEAEPTQH